MNIVCDNIELIINDNTYYYTNKKISDDCYFIIWELNVNNIDWEMEWDFLNDIKI